MTSGAIRQSFLSFFERHGHRVVASSSLVPVDDPTLLFTNAGMNQFKDVFLGRERREYRRAATAQKCMRVSGKHNDLDNVGPSLRHHTFFEMLGNFSFGDYFKNDAIALAWALLTDTWGLPADRLHATVFGGEAGVPADEDAYRRWRDFVPAERISRLGVADNFWAMGDTGPCGRCSEIHYYRGSHLPCPHATCAGVGCDCDRFVEVWNNVFMEFDRQPDGSLEPLPAPSIDTGMGLERITAVLQDKLSNYDTDLFQPVLSALGEMAGRRYGTTPPEPEPATAGALTGRRSFTGDDSMRVVADHLRAMTFLTADGVVPSNEWRGYVLRKIMRRAMRHGKRLGLAEPFLFRLADVVIDRMGGAYPELPRGRDTILGIIRSEEERFEAVLDAGLPRLEDLLDRAAGTDTAVVPGEDVFRLYDSLGVPVDFVEDLASERGLSVDRPGFDRAMEGQRERGRAAGGFEAKAGTGFEFASDRTAEAVAGAGDQFDGYTTVVVPGVPVVGVFDERRREADRLEQGDAGYVVLARTPFYIEAGGQVSDTGWIARDDGAGSATVDGVVRLNPGWPRVHHVRMTSGRLAAGDKVTARVDADARDATRRNHTATHLLHAALRQILGPHVKQAGSLVAPDRLRFDFVHFAPVSRAEVAALERLVNEQIYRNTPVLTEVRATEEAIAAGAMALFGEKYGDRVRVVSVPGFSVELCGGTHCQATGDIGFFTITQESGIAAGVRRIEALTGRGAIELVQRRSAVLEALLAGLGVHEDQAVATIERLQAENRRLARDLQDARVRAALTGAGPALEPVDAAGVKVVAQRVRGLDRAGMRELSDSLRARLTSGVVVLASESDGKVAIVVSVSRDLTSRVSAGDLVRRLAPIVGGGGGGRPDFAEAGGRDPARIDEMLASSSQAVADLVAAAETGGRR